MKKTLASIRKLAESHATGVSQTATKPLHIDCERKSQMSPGPDAGQLGAAT